MLAFGDFNADGRADLVIGTPDEDLGLAVNSGRLDVYPGLGVQLGLGQKSFDQDDFFRDLADAETDDRFGAKLAAGDFDGDGVGDLGIAAPSEDETSELGGSCGFLGTCDDIGMLHVMFGTAGAGAAGGLSEGIVETEIVNYLDLGLGTSVPLTVSLGIGSCPAAYDVNRDGAEELIFGMRGLDLGATAQGEVNAIQFESSSSFFYTSSLGRASADAESFDHLGDACAAGHFRQLQLQFDKDPMVAGCPDCDPAGSGEAGLVVEGVDGDFVEHAQTDFGTAGNGADDGFGRVFAVGDFDDDGFDDLAIGAPGKNDGGEVDSGRVYLTRVFDPHWIFGDAFESGGLAIWSSSAP